ncbi:MAG: YidC/Oxa1 family membrane protein insertase [Candidatus Paceibacterota bacterium]
MINLFNKFLYEPLLQSLVFLYQNFSFHDLGIAIIILTIIIRFVLFPLFYKGAKDQAILQRLTPKIKEIQKNHKDDKEKQTQALLNLYKEHKVNPFSGFLLLLIQLPILIALYKVFLDGLSKMSLDGPINNLFLGIIDLSQRSILLVVIAVVIQYYQGKLALPKSNKPAGAEPDIAERVGRQMVFMGPIMTFVFLYFFNLPSAVALYWLTTSLFSVVQQIFINKRIKSMNI